MKTIDGAIVLPSVDGIGSDIRLLLFSDGFVFTPDPTSMRQTEPPIPFPVWAASVGLPAGCGAVRAAGAMTVGVTDGALLCFDSCWFLLESDTASAAGLTIVEQVRYAKIANLPVDYAPPDAVVRSGDTTYFVKGRECVALTAKNNSGSPEFAASAPTPLPFAADLPPSWPGVDAATMVTRPPYQGEVETDYMVFHTDEVARWQSVNGVSDGMETAPLWDVIEGLPVTSAPISHSVAKKRGFGPWSAASAAHKFDIHGYMRDHQQKLISSRQLAAHLDKNIGFGRDINALSWRHKASDDLRARLHRDLPQDQMVQEYRNARRADDDGSIFIAIEGSGGFGIGGSAGVGVGISTKDGDAVAQALLSAGLGVLGIAGGFCVGYFVKDIETQLGGCMTLTAGGTAGPVGIAAIAFFGASGFLGFAVGLSTGVEVTSEISGGYSWDMGRWDAPRPQV